MDSKIGQIRVGVLMGGCSSEREISLKSGQAVLKALQKAGVDVVDLIIQSEDDDENRRLINAANIDIAFIAMHGRYGEDGGIQALLERMEIVYVGSDACSSRLTINKIATQSVLREAGILVPEFLAFQEGDVGVVDNIKEMFGGKKIVLKPALQGSSIGIEIVDVGRDLAAALERVFLYDQNIIVEEFIAGRELTVGVLGERALPVVEICSSHDFFDFEAKYRKGLTTYIVPAHLDDDVADDMQQIALKTFKALGCRDLSRVDFLLSADRRPHVLEINTIPGFTETSLLPMAAESAGYDFSQLCVTLITMVLKRKQ